MDQAAQDVIQIEGEIATALGHVRLLRSLWDAPIDRSATTQDHHLQLSLMPTSGSAEANFPEHWGPHRFEPIGEMFFLPAGEHVRTRSNCRDQNAIMCVFFPDAVKDWFGGGEWIDGRLQAMLDIHNANIRRLLFRIGEEIRSPGFATETLVGLMAQQVLVELARHFHGLDGDKTMGGLAPWRLRLIDDRLEQDDALIPSLEELAPLCNMSVRHLTRAFRISRGRSIGSYVADHRVDEAKSLLAAGASVKEVAFAMGFTAPSNFAAAFRRATGETPRDYRQRASQRRG